MKRRKKKQYCSADQMDSDVVGMFLDTSIGLCVEEMLVFRWRIRRKKEGSFSAAYMGKPGIVLPCSFFFFFGVVIILFSSSLYFLLYFWLKFLKLIRLGWRWNGPSRHQHMWKEAALLFKKMWGKFIEMKYYFGWFSPGFNILGYLFIHFHFFEQKKC